MDHVATNRQYNRDRSPTMGAIYKKKKIVHGQLRPREATSANSIAEQHSPSKPGHGQPVLMGLAWKTSVRPGFSLSFQPKTP